MEFKITFLKAKQVASQPGKSQPLLTFPRNWLVASQLNSNLRVSFIHNIRLDSYSSSFTLSSMSSNNTNFFNRSTVSVFYLSNKFAFNKGPCNHNQQNKQMINHAHNEYTVQGFLTRTRRTPRSKKRIRIRIQIWVRCVIECGYRSIFFKNTKF